MQQRMSVARCCCSTGTTPYIPLEYGEIEYESSTGNHSQSNCGIPPSGSPNGYVGFMENRKPGNDSDKTTDRYFFQTFNAPTSSVSTATINGFQLDFGDIPPGDIFQDLVDVDLTFKIQIQDSEITLGPQCPTSNERPDIFSGSWANTGTTITKVLTVTRNDAVGPIGKPPPQTVNGWDITTIVNEHVSNHGSGYMRVVISLDTPEPNDHSPSPSAIWANGLNLVEPFRIDMT